jgi:hypothetical protein
MVKDEHFVRVHDPKNTRRIILENTRDILKMLQAQEDFKKLRNERVTLTNEFKKNIDETKNVVTQLKMMLPKVNIKETKTFNVNQPSQKNAAPKELKKLEQELADIEDKLSEL